MSGCESFLQKIPFQLRDVLACIPFINYPYNRSPYKSTQSESNNEPANMF